MRNIKDNYKNEKIKDLNTSNSSQNDYSRNKYGEINDFVSSQLVPTLNHLREMFSNYDFLDNNKMRFFIDSGLKIENPLVSNLTVKGLKIFKTIESMVSQYHDFEEKYKSLTMNKESLNNRLERFKNALIGNSQHFDEHLSIYYFPVFNSMLNNYSKDKIEVFLNKKSSLQFKYNNTYFSFAIDDNLQSSKNNNENLYGFFYKANKQYNEDGESDFYYTHPINVDSLKQRIKSYLNSNPKTDYLILLDPSGVITEIKNDKIITFSKEEIEEIYKFNGFDSINAFTDLLNKKVFNINPASKKPSKMSLDSDIDKDFLDKIKAKNLNF